MYAKEVPEVKKINFPPTKHDPTVYLEKFQLHPTPTPTPTRTGKIPSRSVQTAESTSTSTLARAKFDKVILIYDSLFILLKSLTLNFHVDIGASISKLVSAHPNFVAWVVLDWWMEIQ
jgi:hypothetical protein